MNGEKTVRVEARRGMTLIVVVVLVMLISLSAYRYTFVMESEYRLTRLQEELAQARLSALSGIEYAAHLLEKPQSQRFGFASAGTNERVFRRNMASEEARSDLRDNRTPGWQFGLISAETATDVATPSSSAIARGGSNGFEDSLRWRWGLENESAKLSIPMMLTLESSRPGHFRSVLLTLPGMDEETSDAFLDALGVRRANTVNRQIEPLSETVDRTLRNQQEASQDRVRALWFGGDLNQNYRLDPIETQLLEKLSRSESGSIATRPPGTSTDSRLQPLQRYFTWMSGERNERPDGRPRIYLNHPNLQQLHQQLLAVYPAEVANFVIAYRQYGPSSGPRYSTPNEQTISASEYAPAWTAPGRFMLQSPLDLLGTMVPLPPEGSRSTDGGGATASTSLGNPALAPKKVLKSPFSSDTGERRNYLGKWLSETTVVDAPFLEGRVDVSEAPVEVLRGVPGIDLTLAQRIVEQRRSIGNNPDAMNSIAWLLETGMVDTKKLREIEPFLTTRSDVYTLQSIGFRDNRSPVYRCTAAIDARRIPASVFDLKVWHPWDRGFDIESLNGKSP